MLNEIDSGKVVTKDELKRIWKPNLWHFNLGGVEHTIKNHRSDAKNDKTKFSDHYSEQGKIAKLFKVVRGLVYLVSERQERFPKNSVCFENYGNLCLVLPTSILPSDIQNIGIYIDQGKPKRYEYFKFIVGFTEGKFFMASVYPLQTHKALKQIRLNKKR